MSTASDTTGIVEPLPLPTSSTSSTSSSTAIGLIPFQPASTPATKTTTSSSSSASSTSSSSTSSSTSGSSSSSSTLTTTSTTPITPTTAPNVFTPTTALPAVITEVSTTVVSESTTSIPSAVGVKSATANGFFSNKAAVAGVFTVVGLIGVVIIIFIITNAIRRRRAKQFDNELFAATREAAATAANPNFLDDDDDDSEDRLKHNGFGPAYGGGGGTGYGGAYSSDGSHGPYGPPLEVYGMRDIVPHSSVPVGEIYDPYAAGGAAGIGVARARSANTNPPRSTPNIYAAALQAGGSPYPKFAISPTQGGGAGPPLRRGNSYNNAEFDASRGQEQYTQQTREYPSLGHATSVTEAHVSPLTHAPNHSQSRSNDTSSFPNPYGHKVQPSGGSSDDDAPYGGYRVDGTEGEEEAPKRVLKIANES